MWDDIIGEPEGLRSLDCTWHCSKFCFQVYTYLHILKTSALYKYLFKLVGAIKIAWSSGWEHI
jgi:hypothetical protein